MCSTTCIEPSARSSASTATRGSENDFSGLMAPKIAPNAPSRTMNPIQSGTMRSRKRRTGCSGAGRRGRRPGGGRLLEARGPLLYLDERDPQLPEGIPERGRVGAQPVAERVDDAAHGVDGDGGLVEAQRTILVGAQVQHRELPQPDGVAGHKILRRRGRDLGPDPPQLLGDLGVELLVVEAVVEELVAGPGRGVRLGDVLARRCPKPTHAGNLSPSKSCGKWFSTLPVGFARPGGPPDPPGRSTAAESGSVKDRPFVPPYLSSRVGSRIDVE